MTLTHTYALTVDTAAQNPEWDAFLDTTPGGHHAQSSLWGEVKAVLGWQATRLILRHGAEIVGGVQLLTKPVGRVGRIGFAPRGPIMAGTDPAALEELLDGLVAFGREERILYLKLQPPVTRADMVPVLIGRGWTPSAMEAAPTATIRVDLEPDPDTLLANMRSSTRTKVRAAERKGLTIRAGTAADLGAYYEIVRATSERQGFSPYPRRYYDTMWHSFAPTGRATMFLAEHDGDILSATLVVGFGDSATYKMGGWSGRGGNLRPNEPLHWAGIRWAREAGHRYYDFDGINKKLALEVLARGEVPDEARKGVMGFKLGFGGDVVVFPEALDFSPAPMLRPLVRAAAPRTDRMRALAHRALGREH